MEQEAVHVKVELEWKKAANETGCDATTAGLYFKHEMKDDLVIGPETIQPRDAVFPAHIPVSTSSCDMDVHIKYESDDKVVVKSEPKDVKTEPDDVDAERYKLTRQPGMFEETPDACKHEQTPQHVTYVNIDDLKQAVKIRESVLQFDAVTRITSESGSHVEEKNKPRTNADSKCSEDDSYMCNICSKSFKVKSYLIKHIEFHNQNPYSCKICGKHFPCEPEISTHDCETEKKSFSCNICEKQFEVKSKLTFHEQTHAGIKPHRCEICNKQFLRKYHLSVHKRIHTGEKPYSCEICKKPFSVRSRLIVHLRTHTGEKPYSCKICNTRFSTKYHLTLHERIHTGDKPYSCQICDKRFTYQHALTSHK